MQVALSTIIDAMVSSDRVKVYLPKGKYKVFVPEMNYTVNTTLTAVAATITFTISTDVTSIWELASLRFYIVCTGTVGNRRLKVIVASGAASHALLMATDVPAGRTHTFSGATGGQETQRNTTNFYDTFHLPSLKQVTQVVVDDDNAVDSSDVIQGSVSLVGRPTFVSMYRGSQKDRLRANGYTTIIMEQDGYAEFDIPQLSDQVTADLITSTSMGDYVVIEEA